MRRIGDQEFDRARPAAFAVPLRRHALHHATGDACTATAGHKRVPTNPRRARPLIAVEVPSIGATHFVGEYSPAIERLHRATIAVEECRKGTDLRL